MNRTHNADGWSAYRHELHEAYEHGIAAEPTDDEEFVVTSEDHGPNAVMLERALAIAGRLGNARRRSEMRSGTPTELRLEDVMVTTDKGEYPAKGWQENRDWPEPVIAICVNVVWKRQGQETREGLESDLALTPAVNEHPNNAQPLVTRTHGMNAQLLKSLLLTAYSGAKGNDTTGEEIEEHRSTAEAIVEMTLNGTEGRLAAIERLVTGRVLPCLPAAANRGGGIRVNLFTDKDQTVCAEHVPGADTKGNGNEPEDRRATRRRHNRMRYEETAFGGHRGIEIGTRLPEHTQLWNTILRRADGRTLWDMNNTIRGQLVRLNDNERETARRWTPEPTHAVSWWTVINGTRHEAAHVLNELEVHDLRKRVTGWLIEEAVTVEATEALPNDHPLRALAAEQKTREQGEAGC